jgi:putative phage-type endonuclease
MQSFHENISFQYQLSDSDYSDLLEHAIKMIDTYLDEHVINMCSPSFHTILTKDIFNLIDEQFFDLIESSTIWQNIILGVFQEAESFCFMWNVPVRSFNNSFIRKKYNYDSMNRKISALRNKPQPTQRTKEWYAFRHNLITASSAWKAIDTEKNRNAIIFEKCSPLNRDKFNYVNTDSPMHWGQMFEPVSITLYERMFNTTVEDFGCLPHDAYSFIGASPDGINVDAQNERFGRMLEVKNVVTREITGIPKRDYWIQMQLQMEVCDLNECDFLETKFVEYDSYHDYFTDSLDLSSASFTKDNKHKGMFMRFNNNGTPHYIYPPGNISTHTEYEAWEKHQHDNSMTWINNIYWKLDVLSCVLVLRNKKWFNSRLKEFIEVWDIVVKERTSGYAHRAPSSNTHKKKSMFDGVCMLTHS